MSLANRSVLVINKSWNPVDIIPLERAMNKIFSTYKNGEPKAKIVECKSFMAMNWEDWIELPLTEGTTIKTQRFSFRTPEVIQLTRYDKIPIQKVNFNRKAVYRRDDYTCQYCGKKLAVDNLSIDHVIPKSRGGTTTWANTVSSCIACNSKKADKTPEEAGMKLAKKPIKPKFNLFHSDVKMESWKSFISGVV